VKISFSDELMDHSDSLVDTIRNWIVWNDKYVVGNRLYLTILGLFSLIAVFAIYLAIHAVSNFFDDRRILDGEMKIQQDIKHQFDTFWGYL
jgi:hypothetical protein